MPIDTATRRLEPARPTARTVLVAAIIAGLGAWTIGSGAYIAFHDRILATMLERHAEMQYAYEDRLAALQAALDAASSAAVRDDSDQGVRWRALDARSSRLEARAARLDAMIAADDPAPGPVDPCPRSPCDGLRRAAIDGDAPERRLDALETRQRRAIRSLSTRAADTAARLQRALAELGLAPSRERPATGGPFVPLPAGAATIETALDELQGDLARRDHLRAAAAHLPLRLPVEGRLDVASPYGARRDPFLGRLALHTGIDLREGYGRPVRAVAGGMVASAGTEGGYGLMVEIDHGNGYSTRYAHLAGATVTPGQRVAAGEIVGSVGTSGRSTGPHLHYEIRIAGMPIDPARYVTLAEMIAGR